MIDIAQKAKEIRNGAPIPKNKRSTKILDRETIEAYERYVMA
jgi:hypothetical protein